MRWPFRRRRPAPAATDLTAAGVRTTSDAEYRELRLAEYVALMSDPSPAKIAELTAYLDTWAITPTSSGYLPSPRWDDEAILTRNTFPTIDDARAEVARVGGALAATDRA